MGKENSVYYSEVLNCEAIFLCVINKKRRIALKKKGVSFQTAAYDF